MLNHIWAFLILLSLLTAVGYDVYDEIHDTYRNGKPFFATLALVDSSCTVREVRAYLTVSQHQFLQFYGNSLPEEKAVFPVLLRFDSIGNGTFVLELSAQAPSVWKTMADFSSVKGSLAGTFEQFHFQNSAQSATAFFVFEPLRFVKLRSLTKAAIDFAGTAVEIALGLIGVMALWLGLMKIAEAAGVLLAVTRLLTPITRRLFPDVPSDHPALAAIIMNTAANMLGLSNAATPLGLKAMEELNKLNPRLGTATNAMVTFLAINTGGLILLPATAIAVRAAAGSANPGIIIGTSIVGAGCATVAGVVASKVLQRLPRYRIEETEKNSSESEKHHG